MKQKMKFITSFSVEILKNLINKILLDLLNIFTESAPILTIIKVNLP